MSMQRPGWLNEVSQELVRKTMFSISSAAQRLSRIFEGLSLRTFLTRRGKSTRLSLHHPMYSLYTGIFQILDVISHPCPGVNF